MFKNFRKLIDIKALLMSLVLLGATLIGHAQYCTMTYPSGYTSWGPSQVTIGTFTHSPTFTSDYGNFTAQNVPLTPGVSTACSITTIGWVSCGLAIDLNSDNDFLDPGEVLALPNYLANATQVYSFNITLPPSVVSGNYRMRIWARTANAGNGGYPNGNIPCGAYGYGRYADYTVVVVNNATCFAPSNVVATPTATTCALSWTASTSNPANYRWKIVADGADPITAPAVATGLSTGTTASATGLTAATDYDAYVKSICSSTDSSVWTLVTDFTTLCDGTPATGVATSSVTTVCPTINFNLVLTGVTNAPGISYQWQSSSTATGPFSNIAGGTTATFTTSQSAASYYRCVVTCSSSGLSSTSNVINVGINPATSCYCTPTSTTGTSYNITSFSTNGGLTNITNTGTGSGSYNNYSATMSCSQYMGSAINFSLTTSSSLVIRSIYIDYNQDGAFDENTEKVWSLNYSTVITTSVTGSFTIPYTALAGNTRMRVRTAYYYNTTMNACNNLSYGEAEDYTINILSVSGICIAPQNLAATGVTQTAANVSWTAPPVGNTPTSYIYELRLDGTAAGSGATGLASNGNTGTTSANFTTLDPATNYVFWVRTFCSVGDSSAWNSIPFATSFDTLTPVSLGQFSADVIANGIGAASTTTNNDVDGASYALLSEDHQATATSPLPTSFVPNSRIIQNGFRKYRLANYSGNNSLRQPLASTYGAVRFLAPKRANKVYIMGISGSGVSAFNAIVYFTDGTSQTQAMNFPDWYSATGNIVVSGVGRVNLTSGAVTSGGPKLYDSAMVITTANRNKQIDSIVIQRTGTSTGVSNVLAVSIVPNINQPCKLPGMPTISNLDCTGGTLSFMGNGQNTSYQLSYGAIGSLANSGTIVSFTGTTGANTYQFVNSSSLTTLQLYIRSNCGSGSYSDWVGPLEFTLPSTMVTPTFTLPSTFCYGTTAPSLPSTSNNGVVGTWWPSSVSNTTGDTYTFTPGAVNPCAFPVSVYIDVSTNIVPTFNAIAPICSGSTAPSLPASSINGFSGTWVPATINNTASGIYHFSPSSSGACVDTTSLSVTVLPVSTHTDYMTVCSDSLPIVWNNVTVSAGGSNAATYVTPSANGCDSTTTLNLTVVVNTNPSVNVSASPSTSVGTGTTVTFTATLIDAAGSNPTFQWYKSGVSIPGATGSTWTGVAGTDFLNGETIWVIADGFNNCAAVAASESNQVEMTVSLGIGTGPKPSDFKLYPNPSAHSINIEGLKMGDNLKLVDALGRILISQDVKQNGKFSLDISALNAGTYMILFQNTDGYKWVQKVSKL